jgi:hypothetical protein
MKLEWAVLAGAMLIVASVLFIGRWEIAVSSGGKDGSDAIYRLDRWSGETAMCYPAPSPDSVKRLFQSLFVPTCNGGLKTIQNQ